MADRKAFVLRIDPKMLEAIEKWAEDDFRSVNGQIEYLLNQALRKAGRLKNEQKKKEEKLEDS
jgi:hypothetical protein